MIDQIAQIATANLLSPMVLFFALGVAAALAKSDLVIPEAAAKAMALYLMLAIGFKGGVEVAAHGLDARLLGTLLAGAFLSATVPLIGFALLRLTANLSAYDAAAIAAHYGSISIVTFVAASQTLEHMGIPYEGYLVAVAAVMETPAILVALWLASRAAPGQDDVQVQGKNGVLREIALNGSIVLLVGSFFIGAASGKEGMEAVSPFIVDPFQGVLCLFLLDMGLLAGRSLTQGRRSLTPAVLAFGAYMPLLSASFAALFAWLLGLSVGGSALLITLAASASYIAVPAALRLALPQANPAVYLTMSLGVTFPLNLALGIPLYIFIATMFS